MASIPFEPILASPLDHFQHFQQAIYDSFEQRADAQMELLNALSSNTTAQSVVELSLNPHFRRKYSSISDAISVSFGGKEGQKARQEQKERLVKLVSRYAPRPQAKKYWLFVHDATSVVRRFARTLGDRGYVYLPYAVANNKPVSLGHSYLTTALLLEREQRLAANWLYPLLLERITTAESEQRMAVRTSQFLQTERTLPWHGQLSVHVADSKYAELTFVGEMLKLPNIVTVTRLRGNRVLYWPASSQVKGKRGAPARYGRRFALGEMSSWTPATETRQLPYTSRSGRPYLLDLQRWNGLLERGSTDYRMYEHPFDLVRIRLLQPDSLLPLFKNDLWVKVHGKRRQELDIQEVQQIYHQRMDIEHFLRFGKQRLLLDAFQTPQTEHEESWLHFVQLAYTQLFLMAPLLPSLPRPWECKPPSVSPVWPATQTHSRPTPSHVLRQASTILCQIETPSVPPKPRGISPGRKPGTICSPRPRLAVVKKQKNFSKQQQSAVKNLASP